MCRPYLFYLLPILIEGEASEPLWSTQQHPATLYTPPTINTCNDPILSPHVYTLWWLRAAST